MATAWRLAPRLLIHYSAMKTLLYAAGEELALEYNQRDNSEDLYELVWKRTGSATGPCGRYPGWYDHLSSLMVILFMPMWSGMVTAA